MRKKREAKSEVLTSSEKLFQCFCKANHIRWSRIPKKKSDPTPDYEIHPNGHLVVAEVKELQPNERQTAAEKASERGTVTIPLTTGARLRRDIRRGCRQLESQTSGTRPGIVVFCDETHWGIDKDDVKEAMYSQGQCCTPSAYTSVSAVGVLSIRGERVTFWIFHNCFASSPLPLDWFATPACVQFKIMSDGRRLSDWCPVPR